MEKLRFGVGAILAAPFPILSDKRLGRKILFLFLVITFCMLAIICPSRDARAFSWDFWNKQFVNCPFESNPAWEKVAKGFYVHR